MSLPRDTPSGGQMRNNWNPVDSTVARHSLYYGPVWDTTGYTGVGVTELRRVLTVS